MPIANAVQKGTIVYVYDERGRQLAMLNAGTGKSLQGFTGTSVSIRHGNFIYTYDEKGRQTGTVNAR